MSQDTDVIAGLLDIFSLILKQDFSGREDVLCEEEAGWDSLKHLEIVFAAEDLFLVQFDENEIPGLKSLKDFSVAIRRRQNAA